jgi:hypothetical protein
LKQKKITHEEYMRNVTLQGHSRQVAESYYTIGDGDRSAYDVVTRDDSFILPTTDEVISSNSYQAPLVVPSTSPLHIDSTSAPADNSSMLIPPLEPMILPLTSSHLEEDIHSKATVTSPLVVPSTSSLHIDSTSAPAINSSLLNPPLEPSSPAPEATTLLIEEAVRLVRSHSTLMMTEELSNKQPKFTLEDGVAGINARRDQILALSPPRQIGIDHPCFESVTQRVPSSDAEKNWLFHYYSDALGNGDGIVSDHRGNSYRDCLNAIRVNNFARGIFHERHVMSSDRLKTIALPIIKLVKSYDEDNIVPDWLQF